MTRVSGAVRRLAEDPMLFLAPHPSSERVIDPRYVLRLWGRQTHPYAAQVSRLRLSAAEVEATVEEIRAFFADRGRTASTWKIGSSATPRDIATRLQDTGLVPYEAGPVESCLALIDPLSPVETAVVVRKVETLEEHLTATHVACTAFGMNEKDRAEWLAGAEASFEHDVASTDADTFLAWLDGEPVARATASYTGHGVILFGGATLPEARGQGAYRALVAARWEEAVRRGTPALVTQAGAMSRPILERLGFKQVAELTVLLHRFE